jgi:DNA-binding beta-propeller fold protein YncE
MRRLIGRLVLLMLLAGLVILAPGCGKRLHMIKTGAGPSSLALDARGRYLYVACEGSHTIEVYDVAKRARVGRAAVAPGPLRLYLNRETRTVRVFGQRARRMWVFYGPELKLQKNTQLSAGPSAWTQYLERRMDVLASSETNKLYTFAAGVQQAPLETGPAPADLLLEPGTDKLWVANARGSSLSMIHLEKTQLANTVPVHPNPIRMRIAAPGNTLYVLCTGRDAYPPKSVIQMVDLPNQKAGLTYTVGEDVRDFSLGPSERYFYSVSPQGLLINNLLTDASLKIPTGVDPRALAVSPDGSQVYVACRGSHAVYVHAVDEAFR